MPLSSSCVAGLSPHPKSDPSLYLQWITDSINCSSPIFFAAHFCTGDVSTQQHQLQLSH